LKQTEREKEKEIRKAIQHLNSCQRPEKEWSRIFWCETLPPKEKIGERVEEKVEKISKDYKNRERSKFPDFDPSQVEIEILDVSRLSYGSPRKFNVKYSITVPPCQECKNAREVLKKSSKTYLSVIDGWAEEKFKEMTEKD